MNGIIIGISLIIIATLIVIIHSLQKQLKINDLILIECDKRIEFLKASKTEDKNEVESRVLRKLNDLKQYVSTNKSMYKSGCIYVSTLHHIEFGIEDIENYLINKNTAYEDNKNDVN